MTILGLHHITLATADAQRNIDFYSGVLGLHFVKKTVNFDDPGSYHLYFGDQTGMPGTAITFFEWPHAAKGQPGIGGTHHFALRVPDRDSLLKWKRRLTDLDINVIGPFDRGYFHSIYFNDPDGAILEIATDGPGFAVDEDASQLGKQLITPPTEHMRGSRDEQAIRAETWSEPVPSIQDGMALSGGMHHISAYSLNVEASDAFFSDLLGLRRVKKTISYEDIDTPHWYWGVGEGEPGSLITIFQVDPAKEPPMRYGVGQTHHYAFRVADEETQLEWREKLLSAGLPVSPVMDRIYFKSIYSRDPDGHIVEIATDTPGFLVDEDQASLGTRLCLPPWLEEHRSDIEATLRPVSAPLREAQR